MLKEALKMLKTLGEGINKGKRVKILMEKNIKLVLELKEKDN